MPASVAPAHVHLDELFFKRHFAEIPDATLEAHAPLCWRYTGDLLSVFPPPPPRFVMLTEQVNAIWQAGKSTFYGYRDRRGDPIIIKPIGRRLLCRGSHGGYEWIVDRASDDRTLLHGDLWRDLYLTREDADALVAEVKQSLGLPAPALPQPPGFAGFRTASAVKAECMAGNLIVELVKRAQRPANIPGLIEDLREEVASVGHLSDAAARRQWAKHGPAAWKKGGRRKNCRPREIE